MEFKTNEKYTYEEFLEIMRMLRSEDGCPWDRVQTHDSLKPCMMEEAAELLASIRIFGQTGNCENMREELGDVMLQVVLHSLIAAEEGLFTIEDVIDEISKKMIRRHPHVFGTAEADTPDAVLSNWEDIKKEEKKGKDWIESPLREVPIELSALTRASKVLKKIDKNYKQGADIEEDIAALEKAVERLKACPKERGGKDLERVVGDILLQISDIARIYKLSNEQILADRIDELIDEFEK